MVTNVTIGDSYSSPDKINIIYDASWTLVNSIIWINGAGERD